MAKLSVIGNVYGRLTVLAEAPKSPHQRRVLCQCECGKQKVILLPSLRSGTTRSCGCLHAEWVSEHLGHWDHLGNTNSRTHNRKHTPEYNTWQAMKRRCYDPKGGSYPRYGGRGITVCDRWLNSFENFFADMGEKPSSAHTIDRIDNDQGYSLENCRWATPKEQAWNRSNNRV